MNHDLYWIGQYLRYLETIESFIAHLDNALPLTPVERAALHAAPERELEYAVGFEDLVEATDVFPQVLRRSAFLALFTLLESSLQSVAEEAQRRSGNPIGLEHLRGSGFGRTREYLKLVGGVDLSTLPEWPELHSFQLLRNCLIHRNGAIESRTPPSELERYVASSALLGLDQNGTGHVVFLRPGFCEHAVSVIERALVGLLSSLWPASDPSAA